MSIECLLVEDEDRIGLPRGLLLRVVDLPWPGGRGNRLGNGIVGVDVGGETLQRGEHDGRRQRASTPTLMTRAVLFGCPVWPGFVRFLVGNLL